MMEGTASASTDVRVSRVMHLLLDLDQDDHGRGGSLEYTLLTVYNNLSSIYKAAMDTIEDIRKFDKYMNGWELKCDLRYLLTFCRCSLMVILQEGKVVNKSLYELLVDIESYLLDLAAKDPTNLPAAAVHFAEKKDLMPRIVRAYLFDYSQLTHQLIGYELLKLQFRTDVACDLFHLCGEGKTLEENFSFLSGHSLAKMLTKYSCGDLEEILKTIQIVTYKVACFSFLTKFCRLTFPSEYEMIRECIDSDVNVGVLKVKALFFQLDGSIELVTDEFLVKYVNSVQQYLIEQLKDEDAIDLSRVLRKRLLFLERVLISNHHPILDEKLQGIKVQYKALLGNMGFVIHSCLDDPVRGSITSVLYDLLEKVDMVRHQVLETILDMISGGIEQEYLIQSEPYLFIFLTRKLKEFMDQNSSLMIGEQIESDVGIRLLKVKAVVLQLAESKTVGLMTDGFLTEYVNSVQEYLIELVQDEVAVDLSNVLHEGLLFLKHVIINRFHSVYLHPSEEEKLSGVRVQYRALLGNIGSVIYSCFYNRVMEGSITSMLYGLIEQVDHIKEETIETVCFIMLGRMQQEYLIKSLPYLFVILLENLKEFMDCRSNLMITWKDQFDPIQQKLLLVRSIRQHITSQGTTKTQAIPSYEFEEGIEDSARSREKHTEILKCTFTFFEHYQFRTSTVDEELKEYLILSQVVALRMACYSLLRRCGRFNWSNMYSKIKDQLDSPVQVGILGGMLMSLEGSRSRSTTTSLIDEIPVGYVDCIQHNLSELLYVKAIDSRDGYQFKIAYEGLLPQVHLRSCPNMNDRAFIQEKLSAIRFRFQEVLSSMGHFIFSFFNNNFWGNVETDSNDYDWLSDSLAKLNQMKDETMDIDTLAILGRVGRESPRTNQLGFMSLLLDTYWKELMDYKSDLKLTLEDQFQMVHENLLLFRSFIQNVTNSATIEDESSSLCNRMADAGYMAEFVLSSFAGGLCPVRRKSLWMSELMEHIELIKADMIKAREKGANDEDLRGNDKDPSHEHLQALVPTVDVVVGFRDEMEQIIDCLLAKNAKQQDVVSIVGMGGLGKTTLAKKVYEDPDVVSYFDIRAWCYVSQEYSRKHLFLKILSSMIELTDLTRQMESMDDAQLSIMLHKELMGRRYFIVLDDVWDTDAFLHLKRFLPDDGNGSKILLTTRIRRISESISRRDRIQLRSLSDEQSWELLERKIYGEQRCPLELHKVGVKITRKCSGIPLAIILVSGILGKSENLDFWEQVAQNFRASHFDSPMKGALELSYNYLPDYLKPLFLYFGAFPGDIVIPTDKLIWLWIAEGFVPKTEFRSPEVQAEIYLMDLISRNLVMVAERSDDGRVKSCYVHDLVLDMCLVKAKEENFMQQIYAYDESPHRTIYQRRLSISSARSDRDVPITYDFLSTLSVSPPLRTFLFFNMSSSQSWLNEGTKSVISSLKLLRVLHSENTTIPADVYGNVMELVYLQYLSIRISGRSIPSSISNLWKLESLIIEGLEGEIEVPETIWEMVRLRHLHIDPGAKFTEASNNSSKLENLETLSTPVIVFGEEEKLIARVPNLQKLRCVFTPSNYSYRNICPDFESLGKLESLKVSYYGTVKLAGQLKLPLNLKKLSIYRFGLGWDQISIFQNLKILTLRSGAVEGEIWDTGDVEFPNLKVLKLEKLNIIIWDAWSSSFPQLETLILYKCEQLEEIPADIGCISTLERIEVLWCSPSAALSAMEIQKEQQIVMGNASLIVHICW